MAALKVISTGSVPTAAVAAAVGSLEATDDDDDDDDDAVAFPDAVVMS